MGQLGLCTTITEALAPYSPCATATREATERRNPHPANRVAPCLPQLEKALMWQGRHSAAKNKKKKKKKKKKNNSKSKVSLENLKNLLLSSKGYPLIVEERHQKLY